MPDPGLDEIDELFVRAGLVEPPNELVSRVMMQVRAEGVIRPRRIKSTVVRAYAGAYVLALLALSVLAYELGLAIARSGASSLLSVIAGDMTLLTDAPGAYAGALVASLPWLHLAAAAIDVAILAILTSLITRYASSPWSRQAAGAVS